MRKKKRKYVYCQQPTMYDVDSCPKCGKLNITWSEYVDMLWCFDCKIDFVPEHWGVFDGPIPMQLSKLLGMSFDRIEIKTGKLISFDSDEFKNTRP